MTRGRIPGKPIPKPTIVSRDFTREMAQARLQAIKASRKYKYKYQTINPVEVSYFLGMLDAFDRQVRPTIDTSPPPEWRANKEDGGTFTVQYKYSPLEMYEKLFSYFQTSIEMGMSVCISHMAWYCGFNSSHFGQMMNDNYQELHPRYGFLREFVSFMSGMVEFDGQDKQNPAFQIFWLKNRGWVDKLEISASSTIGALTEEQRQKAQKRIAQFSE